MSEERLQRIVQSSFNEAISRQQEYVTLEHLLVAILDDGDIRTFLHAMGISSEEIQLDAHSYLDHEVEPVAKEISQAKKTIALERVFQRAVAQGIFSGRQVTDPLDILGSILSEENSHAAHFCEKHGLTKDSLIDTVTATTKDEEMDTSTSKRFNYMFR